MVWTVSIRVEGPQSSNRLSRIPPLDFFFHPSNLLHVLSGLVFGLDPPKSDEGGVVGGVIGSGRELCPLAESSVMESRSPLPLEVLLRARLDLVWVVEGVRRPVGSEAENGESTSKLGDARRLDLPLVGFFSFELSEPPRFLRGASKLADRSCLILMDLEDGGASFKNEISTDSSIRL